uniref:Putative secreted protein n=1 Tax=Ixodes ricinus TaxID=34613 RepID=A0A6B0U0X1_IXORI
MFRTFSTWPLRKLSSSSAVALKSCFAMASIFCSTPKCRTTHTTTPRIIAIIKKRAGPPKKRGLARLSPPGSFGLGETPQFTRRRYVVRF